MKALLTPVLLIVVIGGISGLGVLLGLGNAAVLAALCAMFCMLAAFGGSLHADLRLLARFGPTLILAATAPRLLAEITVVGAIALLTVIIFGAGLLPAFGSRYVTVGLGLGMAALFSYGYQLTGAASIGQLLAAPALAVGLAIVVRLLAGARDPSKPTRTAIADLLASEQDAPAGEQPVGAPTDAIERAGRLWFGDRPPRWTGQVLGAALRYHSVRGLLRTQTRVLTSTEAKRVSTTLRAASAEAARLAEHVRAPAAAGSAPEVARAEQPPMPAGAVDLLTELWAALDRVHAASTERATGRVRPPRRQGADLLRSTLRGTLSWRSAQLRHAVRCALGVCLALAVARLHPGDPLTISFLLTTFAVMQPSWRDSLSKARQRVLGSVGGAVLLGLVLWLLPESALLPVALVAVLLGASVMRTAPTVFNGCIVLMAVGMNATTRQLDPRELLIEYLLLIALAVAIGLLFGFAAIPGVRPPSVAERVRSARAATSALLDQVADRPSGQPDSRELSARYRAASLAQQQLTAFEPGGAQPPEATEQALTRLADGLWGVHNVCATLLVDGVPAPLLPWLNWSAATLRAPGTERGRLDNRSEGDSLGNLPTNPGSALDAEHDLLATVLVVDVLRSSNAAEELLAPAQDS
ncbi:FUSC family protein [Tamaricihabitans halophyticus]|nr:FUSC family protein [Tamaricihabitans halophyticus]